MKQTKGFQIWQIIYPVGLYYVVSSLCYFALEILLGSADETYMPVSYTHLDVYKRQVSKGRRSVSVQKDHGACDRAYILSGYFIQTSF